MATPVPLRGDFDGFGLRRLARATKDAAQARRLLALAAICKGGSRTDAAKVGSVTLQIIRNWVVRFNERGPAGLVNRKAPDSPSKLNEEQRQAMAKIVGAARSRRCTAWCAGGARISCSGSPRSSASRWTRRRSGAS